MSRSHLARIELIGDVLDAFKCDTRYKVKYNNLNHAYQLYLNATNELLAEFGNQETKDKLIEPAFRDSYSQIERKISLAYQMKFQETGTIKEKR